MAQAHRFYAITSAGVRAVPRNMDCPSDFDAMIHGGKMLGVDGSVEVWHGARFVGEVGQAFSRWSRDKPLKVSPDLGGHSSIHV